MIRTPRLCLVTDPAVRQRPLAQTCRLAALGGADLVQVRAPGMPDAALFRLAAEIVAAVRGTGARVVVNDRFDVALAAGADGVHLKGSGIPTAIVRAAVPPGFIVGRSVHDAGEARAAALEGADYVIAGPVFETPSKAPLGFPPIGIEGLRRAAEACRAPVLAIGGINASGAVLCAAAGASGVAAVRALIDAEDPEQAARGLLRAVEPSNDPHPAHAGGRLP